MLDVRRLEVLSATVREGSIAGAARLLAITPSAASQALAALESQAGVRLVERLARGVRPTAAGERLAAHGEAVLGMLARAQDELDARPRSVRVAAFPTAVLGLLPAALRMLRAGAPDVAVDIRELEPDEGRLAVRAGECDVALVNHHAVLAPDVQGPWRVVHLCDEPVLAALPREHRLADRDWLRVADLDRDPWIMQKPASPCQDLVQRVCGANGFVPGVAASCGDYRAILGLVGAGVGVSLVPQMAVTGLDLSSVALVRVRPSVHRRVNALISSRPATSSAARTLVDALVEVSAGLVPAAAAS